MAALFLVVIIWASGDVTTEQTSFPSMAACKASQAEFSRRSDDRATNTIGLCIPRHRPQ